MRRATLAGLLGAALATSGCLSGDDDASSAAGPDDTALKEALAAHGGEAAFRLPDEGDFPAIPQDPRNPITGAKVALGRRLFHDARIGVAAKTPAGIGTYSCATCHHAMAGFQAGRPQGIGDGGTGFGRAGESRAPDSAYPLTDIDVQPIRTPSAMNAAWQTVTLWNGQFGAGNENVGTEDAWTTGTPKENNRLGYQGLETQAIAGIGVHRLGMDPALADRLGYRPDFDAAFPEVAGDERYSRVTAGLAIAAYERTLLADRAPFQRWLRGDVKALDDRQKRGAALFFGKGGCVQCHDGPSLGARGFHALGMADLGGAGVYNVPLDDPAHRGRGGFTGRPQDMYRFKTPQLYNLADATALGHGASFADVDAVIRYKNAGIPENARVPSNALSTAFRPLGLTDDERAALVDFVANGLRDPALDRYVPAPSAGSCVPAADEVSRRQVRCAGEP